MTEMTEEKSDSTVRLTDRFANYLGIVAIGVGIVAIIHCLLLGPERKTFNGMDLAAAASFLFVLAGVIICYMVQISHQLRRRS